ncbi:MAG TPA: hypothetical protein VFY70_02115 [Thermomicrobiales bacterium]|jgi:hypothetical protein|nr:hypothetical protein [Thermomicrobiales bacterium]
MDQFRAAIVVIAISDTRWGPRDAHGRRREFTADELDDLVDFGWHWADVKGRLATCAHALRQNVGAALIRTGEHFAGVPRRAVLPEMTPTTSMPREVG